LSGLQRHPCLKTRLALKGGRALSLFVLDVPRLSVDLDVNVIGTASREAMLAERPKVEQAVAAVCGRRGLQARKVPASFTTRHGSGRSRLDEVGANTKPSMTLRFLETNEVFTLSEFMTAVDPDVSRRTRETNLRNAIARGQACRITRGLYASNIGVYRDRVPNVMLVAGKAAPDAVLAYHSALKAHGVAHTPAHVVYFVSKTKVSPFAFRGYRFRRAPDLQARAGSPRGTPFISRLRVGDALVLATSRERTFVDCLARVHLAGGLEELLRSVGSFTTMSSADIASYLSTLGSPTLTARAGWIMKLMASDWLPDAGRLEAMRATLGRGTYWLQPRRKDQDYEFVARWRLYVPAGLPYSDWLRG